MSTTWQTDSLQGAFVLSYADVAKILSDINLGTLIAALAGEIEGIYRDRDIRPLKRMGWSTPPNALEIMGCQAEDYTCVKLISSVPAVNGSPTVTGTLVCTEVGSDRAKLVCDAAFLTPLRTAASTGVVMRKVTPLTKALGIVGSGLEGITHAVALACMLESLETLFLFDADAAQASRAAEEVEYFIRRDGLLSGRKLSVMACEDQADLPECDALVTATYAEPGVSVLNRPSEIRAGTFIAAVGADLQEKRELPDSLYGRAKFVADDLNQCLDDGELQYAKDVLGLTNSRVADHRGHLADGRIVSVADFLSDPQLLLSRDEEVTIYDSVGFSGQDLALARVMLKLLAEREWPKQEWNPGYSRSLVELLGCAAAFQRA